MDKLIPVFESSLFDSNLRDIGEETLELGIDSILDDGLLKDIPIVHTIVGVAKTAQNIYDRNLLRQTATFISEFNNGTIDKDKLIKYRQKLDSDSGLAEKELGRVLILLNSYIDLEKSKILANFYKAYAVEEKISWDKFCELSEVNTRLFINDLEILKQINCVDVDNSENYENYQIERLTAIGLLDYREKGISFNTTSSKPRAKSISSSMLGKLFIDLL